MTDENMNNTPDEQDDDNMLLQYLTELLERDADQDEFEQQIFLHNLEQTEQDDPDLAAMLRACAIPRQFDAAIIGVLRDAPDDTETNERLLAALLEYAFVLERQGRTYVYHDNTRDMLMAEWQKPEFLEQYTLYRDRLIAFYVQHGVDAYTDDDNRLALNDFNRALELNSRLSDAIRGKERVEAKLNKQQEYTEDHGAAEENLPG